MKGITWIGAATVSLVAHGALAALIDEHDVHHARKRPPVIVQLATPPKPAPHVEPPPPPPPPPPTPKKPQLVKKLAPKPAAPAAPPPPAAPKIGIDETATAAASDIAVATGVTQEGEPGTGNSTDKTPAPPAPPEPPRPAAPPALPHQHFVPIYQVTRMPKAKHAVPPVIPDAFRDASREALVVIEVELDVQGHVTAAKVVRHADFGLDDAALAAARQTEFEPALVGTQPVPVRYQIPYRFRVRG